MRLQLSKPDCATACAFAAGQRDAGFSYPAVGATRDAPSPEGYAIDHNRARLGTGEAVFHAACEALRRWKMFDLGWVCVPKAPSLATGEIAVVAARVFGVWVLNAARIVYVREDSGPIQRFGFAYGTLPHHVERGEERFTIEWDHADDSVHYDLFAFSRPKHPLVWLGYPIARRLQRKCARASLRAMQRVGRRAERGGGS